MPQWKRITCYLVVCGLALALFGARATTAKQQQQSEAPSPKPELVLQTGHLGAIRSIAFAPDGATIATGSSDQTVKLWDAKTGALQRTLGGHEEEVRKVFYSHDGQTLVSECSITPDCSTGDGDVVLFRFWGAPDFKLSRSFLDGGYTIHTVTLSPDLKTLANFDGINIGTTEIRDVGTNKVKLRPTDFAGSAIFSPDSKWAIFDNRNYADGNDEVWLANAQTWQMLRKLKLASGGRMFTPDGKRLVCLRDGALSMLDLSTEKVVWRIDLPRHQDEGGTTLALAPDGLVLAATDAGQVKLFDARTGKAIRAFHSGATALAFSPDSKTLATGDGQGNLRLWDAPKVAAKPLWTAPGNRASLSGIFPAPDGKTVFIVRQDKTISQWNLQTGEVTQKPFKFGQEIKTIRRSPDGKTVAIDGCDEIILWRPQQKFKLQPSSRYHGVRSYAFAPDSKTFVAASHNLVDIWSVATGKKLARPITLDSPVTNVRFLPRGQRLLVASGASVSLWDVSTQKMVAHLSLISFRQEGKPDGKAVNEWIVSTPENFFYGSDDADQFIHWREGDELSPSIYENSSGFLTRSPYYHEFHSPVKVSAAILQIGQGLPTQAPNGKASVTLGYGYEDIFAIKVGDCDVGWFDASIKKLGWNAASELVFDYGKLIIDWGHACTDQPFESPKESPAPDLMIKTLLTQTAKAGIKKIVQYTVSPTGNRVTFTGLFNEDCCDQEADLWLINRTGSGLRRLTKDGAIADPAWSPVVDKIVFVSHGSVKLLDLRTGRTRSVPGLKAFTEGDYHSRSMHGDPGWSHDGQFLATRECDGGSCWVNVASVENGQKIFRSSEPYDKFAWNGNGELEIKGLGKLVFKPTQAAVRHRVP